MKWSLLEIGEGNSRPYPVRLVDFDVTIGNPKWYNIYYTFKTTKGIKYGIHAESIESSSLDISFKRENGHFSDITNEFDFYRILQTVLSCTQLIHDKTGIKVFDFSGGDDGESADSKGLQRERIYLYFIRKQFPGARVTSLGEYGWRIKIR